MDGSYTRIVKCLVRHTFISFEKMKKNKIIHFDWLLLSYIVLKYEGFTWANNLIFTISGKF